MVPKKQVSRWPLVSFLMIPQGGRYHDKYEEMELSNGTLTLGVRKQPGQELNSGACTFNVSEQPFLLCLLPGSCKELATSSRKLSLMAPPCP